MQSLRPAVRQPSAGATNKRSSPSCRPSRRTAGVAVHAQQANDSEPVSPPVHPSSINRPGSRSGSGTDLPRGGTGPAPSSPMRFNPADIRPGPSRGAPGGDPTPSYSAAPSSSLLSQSRPSGSRTGNTSFENGGEVAFAGSAPSSPAAASLDRPSGGGSRGMPIFAVVGSGGGGDGDASTEPDNNSGDGGSQGLSVPWLLAVIAAGAAVIGYYTFIRQPQAAAPAQPAVGSCCASKKADTKTSGKK